MVHVYVKDCHIKRGKVDIVKKDNPIRPYTITKSGGNSIKVNTYIKKYISVHCNVCILSIKINKKKQLNRISS